MTHTTEHAWATDDLRVQRARKRAQDMRGLYVHLLVYVCINGGLLFLDAVTGGGWWFFWVAIPWGIGLATHVVGVATDGLFGPEWEERQVDRYLRHEADRHR
jgi:2TM domain